MNRLTHTAVTSALALGLCLTACTTSSSPAPTSTASAASGSATPAAPTGRTHFAPSDLTWQPADEVKVTLADGSSSGGSGVSVSGSTVTITAAGVYRVTGSLSNGQLAVAVPGDAAVVVVLDQVTITNSAGPAVSVTSGDKVTLVLADGTTSTLTDGTGYQVPNDATPVAAVASASDLTIAGRGSLKVTGSTNDAISTRDGLVIASGTIQATAQDDGIRGKDYVDILDGDITVQAAGDAISSDNVKEADRGWLRIAGGTTTITGSKEGLEAKAVTISGGTVSITATDDGISASAGTSDGSQDDGSLVTISGGTVTIKAGSDGIDSNGRVELTGGTITITSATGAATGPVDANGPITLSGATLTANGTPITSVDQLKKKR